MATRDDTRTVPEALAADVSRALLEAMVVGDAIHAVAGEIVDLDKLEVFGLAETIKSCAKRMQKIVDPVPSPESALALRARDMHAVLTEAVGICYIVRLLADAIVDRDGATRDVFSYTEALKACVERVEEAAEPVIPKLEVLQA